MRVWVVVYSHEGGTDVTPCDSEEVARLAALNLGEEYFYEFDSEQNEYSGTIQKALSTGNAELLVLRWSDFTAGSESLCILEHPLRTMEDFVKLEEVFPWNLQPGNTVKWNNPQGDTYVFPIQAIFFEKPAGDLDGQVRIQHENGELVTSAWTLGMVENESSVDAQSILEAEDQRILAEMQEVAGVCEAPFKKLADTDHRKSNKDG